MLITGFAIANFCESFQMAPTWVKKMESHDLRELQLGSLPAGQAE